MSLPVASQECAQNVTMATPAAVRARPIRCTALVRSPSTTAYANEGTGRVLLTMVVVIPPAPP